VRQSACPAAAAARKYPAGEQLCKWPSKNWQARESPNPKQMPVTSNVTRSLDIHNSKQKSQPLLGKLNSPQIFFMAQIPGWGSSYKRVKPQTWLKVGKHTYPGDKKKKCCYPIGVWSIVCNRWRSRIMAQNPSTLSHVDCKEEEESPFSKSPSLSLTHNVWYNQV
jgi:hypothetical protein